MAKMQFKFKSVGEKPTDRRNDNTGRITPQNLGFKTPLRSSGNSDIFDMHQDPREQLRDNLKNLILTNKGERLGMPEYGVSLKSISYDFSNKKEYVSIVNQQIIEQTRIYIPAIVIKNVSVDINDDTETIVSNRQGLALLKLNVLFDVPVLRSENLAIQIAMYIGG